MQDSGDQVRRNELADFLKRRRSQLRPEKVGLRAGNRRRTPGLRREEVAELAGIGSSWYTWIEQGRPVTPSKDVVDRLARALRLNEDEYAYVTRLARPLAETVPAASAEAPAVPDRLAALLQVFTNHSAYIRNYRWDLLAWNSCYACIFGDYASVPPERRNILRLLFMERRFREVMWRWKYSAENVVARFRADLTKAPRDQGTADLVATLIENSPEFARIWNEHCTKEISTHPLDLDLPGCGRATVERCTLEPDIAPGLKLIVHMPTDPQSERKMSDFLAMRSAALAKGMSMRAE